MRHQIRFFALGWLFMVLAGCATYQPVPEGYVGPTATIFDTGLTESAAKAQMFVVAEIDGNQIQNSLGASARASYGQGFALRSEFVSRKIPARPMKMKLRGTHTTGAPIHALFSQMSGTFHSVEGVVDFSPAPSGVYKVKGELSAEKSSVWVEDVETGRIVTEKISAK